MAGDIYHVTEFYRTGEERPFSRRSGITAHPCVGDTIDAFGVSGHVVTVNWNMDYAGRPDERWRCNIYIKPFGKPDGET